MAAMRLNATVRPISTQSFVYEALLARSECILCPVSMTTLSPNFKLSAYAAINPAVPATRDGGGTRLNRQAQMYRQKSSVLRSLEPPGQSWRGRALELRGEPAPHLQMPAQRLRR